MRVKAYDDISLSYLSVTCKPDEFYLLNVATPPKLKAAQNSMFGPWCLASFQWSAWQRPHVEVKWSHQMASRGIIPKTGSIVCSETVGRWSTNSQPEATGLLQKTKNIIDVSKKTIPRIFLVLYSSTQLWSCMISWKKKKEKKKGGSILLTAISNQKFPCQRNLILLHDYYVMYVKW